MNCLLAFLKLYWSLSFTWVYGYWLTYFTICDILVYLEHAIDTRCVLLLLQHYFIINKNGRWLQTFSRHGIMTLSPGCILLPSVTKNQMSSCLIFYRVWMINAGSRAALALHRDGKHSVFWTVPSCFWTKEYDYFYLWYSMDNNYNFFSHNMTYFPIIFKFI